MRKNKFGEYFNKCRTASGLSLQDVADFLHLSKPYIWGIEQGNNKPPQRYDILNNLAIKFNLKDEQRDKLFDLATEENDLPADIKLILLQDKTLQKQIRENNRGERQ
jgi:transcriptional regulator with XRE-family HTH domain